MPPSQAEEYRDNETVTRLLWEIRVLHSVGYHTWRLEAEQYFTHPDDPLGVASLVLWAVLQQESQPSEVIAKIGGEHDPGDGW